MPRGEPRALRPDINVMWDLAPRRVDLLHLLEDSPEEVSAEGPPHAVAVHP